MIDYLVNNIRLIQILTIISATITILLEIYFIIKNIKKKYEKSINTECKSLKEETIKNIIPDETVKENDKKQEILTKPINEIYDYGSYSIMYSDYKKKIKDIWIEILDVYSRNFIVYNIKKTHFICILNKRTDDDILHKQSWCHSYLEHNLNRLRCIMKNKKEVEFDNIINEIFMVNKDKNANNKNVVKLVETGTSIGKSCFAISWMFEKDYFRDDTSKNLEELQQFRDMLRKYLESTKEKSNKEAYLRFIKEIEEYSEVIHENNEIAEEKKYKNCQFNEAKGHSTVNVTQNNGISKNELKEIIDLIEKDLDKLNQEQAEDLKDTLSMVVEEFDSEAPRQGRLKKCLTLLAPMITVTNDIPVLAQNLQKVCDYILPFIN